jgi:hypothetical protein
VVAAADPLSIFGPVVSGADVESWCVETLRKWSSTYLTELENRSGRKPGSLQRVRAFVTVPTFDKWPEDQLPALLVISVGLSERPKKSGDGTYDARWRMTLGVICSARTQAEAHELAMDYTAWHRELLLNRQSLEGRAAGVDFIDEKYDTLPFDDTRSLGAGEVTFTVEVHDVASAYAGPITPADPLEPDTTPWPHWPTVKTTDVEVEHVGEITNPQVTPYDQEEEQ